jgi:thiamine-phosphate pyrophosphorylase
LGDRVFQVPRLYPIIDRATLDARGIGVGEFAAELAAAGVRMVQYRDKRGGPREVLRGAAAVSKAFAGVECVLVMNDRADLAVLAGWRAVHVGQGDMAVEDARRVLGGKGEVRERDVRDVFAMYAMGVVGVSTHTVEQVRASCKPTSQNRDVGHPYPGEGPDYVAIGPVFATGTKMDAEPVVGLEGVRRARALTKRPLVAIGGITLANARSVVEAGADSVAVIGGLFVEGRTVGDAVRDFVRVLG